MIKVTVEILPGGYAACRRTVGLMHIANLSNLARRSDYKVDIMEGDNPLAGTGALTCTVYVRHHDRNQSVWCLIAAALAAANGKDLFGIDRTRRKSSARSRARRRRNGVRRIH
jgi:hypothetical protein